MAVLLEEEEEDGMSSAVMAKDDEPSMMVVVNVRPILPGEDTVSARAVDNDGRANDTVVETANAVELPKRKSCQSATVIGACVGLVVLALCGSLLVARALPLDSATTPQKPPRDEAAIRAHLDLVMQTSWLTSRDVNLNILASNSSTREYHLAMDWILHEDPLELDVSSDVERRLVTRFTLALFYFQTSQDHPWRSCNPTFLVNSVYEVDAGVAKEEDVANGDEEPQSNLCTVYDAVMQPDGTFVDVPRKEPAISWLSGAHECEWAGVSCHHEFFANSVTGIDLGKKPTSYR